MLSTRSNFILNLFYIIIIIELYIHIYNYIYIYFILNKEILHCNQQLLQTKTKNQKISHVNVLTS